MGKGKKCVGKNCLSRGKKCVEKVFNEKGEEICVWEAFIGEKEELCGEQLIEERMKCVGKKRG